MAAHSNVDGVEKIFVDETQQWVDVAPDTTPPDAKDPVGIEATTSVAPVEPAVEDLDRDIKVLAAFELIHGKYGQYDNETYVKLTDDGFDPEEIFAIRLAILNGQPY